MHNDEVLPVDSVAVGLAETLPEELVNEGNFSEIVGGYKGIKNGKPKPNCSLLAKDCNRRSRGGCLWKKLGSPALPEITNMVGHDCGKCSASALDCTDGEAEAYGLRRSKKIKSSDIGTTLSRSAGAA